MPLEWHVGGFGATKRESSLEGGVSGGGAVRRGRHTGGWAEEQSEGRRLRWWDGTFRAATYPRPSGRGRGEYGRFWEGQPDTQSL